MVQANLFRYWRGIVVVNATLAVAPKFTSLRNFPIFAALDEDSIATLSTSVLQRNWPAGTTLFQRGDASDHLLAITRGKVRLSLASPQGREIVLRNVGAGDIIGEIALIDGQPRSADAVATEDTSGLLLFRDRFLAVAALQPEVTLAVAHYLCSLLRNTNYQMESIALYDLQTRLVRFLLFTLDQLNNTDTPLHPVLRIGFSQGDLSAVLGASRPKVNRALQSLLAAGAIRKEGDLLACNLPLLRRLAEADETAHL